MKIRICNVREEDVISDYNELDESLIEPSVVTKVSTRYRWIRLELAREERVGRRVVMKDRGYLEAAPDYEVELVSRPQSRIEGKTEEQLAWVIGKFAARIRPGRPEDVDAVADDLLQALQDYKLFQESRKQ